MRRTLATATAAAVLGGAGLAAAAPARAALLDPSAYGVAAAGPLAVPAQPAVDWTSGTPLAAGTLGLQDGALSVGPMGVAAGEGYAVAHIANLRYGSVLNVASLTATCADGHTSVTIAGTADGTPLRPGMRLTLPGGYAEVGATTTNDDGSVTVTGLTLAVNGEVLLAAVARC